MQNDFLKNPTNLQALLYASDTVDLDILVDYITDAGKGRIALDDADCVRLINCKTSGQYSESDRNLIGYEIRRFGGNTLANTWRDLRNSISYGGILDSVLPDANYSIGYDEVVRDVAEHLKVSFNKDTDVIQIEDGVLRKILQSAFEKMSSEEKAAVLKELNVADLSAIKPLTTAALIVAGKAGGFATYKLAIVVANAIAKTLLGRGLPFIAGPIITRTLSVVLGPIGWAITALWTVADFASPAYRVTVPCVVQIAYMRQKALAKAYATDCGKCGALNSVDAKFCSECGAPMQTNESKEQTA